MCGYNTPKPSYEELAVAFRAAVDHLDYCGWSDKYEREAATIDGSRQLIEAIYQRLIPTESE